MGIWAAWRSNRRWRSSPAVTVALTRKRSLPTSTVAAGCASKLWYHAGCLGAPANEAITVSGVHQGFRYRPTTSGAGHRQEQHGHIGELPAHLPLIRAEFTNHALIEIMQFRHISSFGQ